jgi:hypothetical protein
MQGAGTGRVVFTPWLAEQDTTNVTQALRWPLPNSAPGGLEDVKEGTGLAMHVAVRGHQE